MALAARSPSGAGRRLVDGRSLGWLVDRCSGLVASNVLSSLEYVSIDR